MFFEEKNQEQFPFDAYNYVCDAVDTVSAKLALVDVCRARAIPIISCMGAGNKLDPTTFAVADIYQTSICPLARVMRHELRKRGIPALKVVYSKEAPIAPFDYADGSCKHHCVCPPDTRRNCAVRRQVPGSVSFVPSVAGLILAGEIIKDIARAEEASTNGI
jgi:tRNA A37 threonylcarbamoyladenosine dehydratase